MTIWIGNGRPLSPEDPVLKRILTNSVAGEIRRLTAAGQPEAGHSGVTNAFGELIAANSKSIDFFQADEEWWQTAFDGGKGRVFVSSIVTPEGREPGINVAVPIYDMEAAGHPVIGILKDRLNAAWVLEPLSQVDGSAQLLDGTAGKTSLCAHQGRARTRNGRTQQFYLQHRNEPRDSRSRRCAVQRSDRHRVEQGAADGEVNPDLEAGGGAGDRI